MSETPYELHTAGQGWALSRGALALASRYFLRGLENGQHRRMLPCTSEGHLSGQYVLSIPIFLCRAVLKVKQV